MIRVKKLLLYKIDLLKQTSFILNLFFFLISISLFSSCHNNDFKKQNDIEKHGLKGRVSSLKDRYYSAYMKFGKVFRTTDKFICYLDPKEEEPSYKFKENNEN